jgi:hypothetical protein
MENYFEDVCKVLDKLTDKGRTSFQMNLRTMLYMSVLMNTYRAEIIAKSPPDIVIKALGWLAKRLAIQYQER